MAALFGSGNQAPTRLNAVKITQSCLGLPFPTVLGTGKIQQSLLWLNGFSSVSAPQGGKGGGKSNGYIYSSDAIVALCNGPILAVKDLWSDQSWIANSTQTESTTISSPGIYTPQQASTFIADNGVSVPAAYNQVFNDLNAPSTTTLSGTDNPPMTLVPYGSPLNLGEYSISTATIGTFALSAAAAAATISGQVATVYTGTGFGAVNALQGYTFVVTGFTNAANNGSFTCISNTSTTVTLANTVGVLEAHTGSAAEIGVTYHFSAADQAAGTEVLITYSFNLPYITAQENGIVPSGGSNPLQINVNAPWWYGVDKGVIYYSSGDVYNPLNGVALTPTSTNPPTVTGTYHFQSSGTSSTGSSYKFAPGDVNQEVQITYQYQNMQPYVSNGNATGIPQSLQFTLFPGEQGQAPASLLTDSFASEALGYSNTAYALFSPMNLGAAGQIPNLQYEVQTADMYGGGIADCNPVQCLWQVLTNPVWGLGSGVQPFPVDVIDNSPNGTWGSAHAPGVRQTESTAWSWFAANSFFISAVLDKQDSASSVMGDWLEAGMCAAFMSEGLFKLVPYGDTSTAGNGCTWVAPYAYVAALDDTCFVRKDGQDPVKISRSAWQDAHNNVQVKWDNRGNQYAPEITPDSDQTSINRYGLRIEDPINFDFIHTLAAATCAASLRVKRMVNIRNTYVFTLPFTFSYLEPMDIVTISSSSVWNTTPGNVNLNLVNAPVRIQKIVDDPVEGLNIEAEDYPYGVGQPVLFNKGIASGIPVVNAFDAPGSAEVVMFEATGRLTGNTGNQIWIGALGTSSKWGGCQVWVSRNGTDYKQVGTIENPARIGELAAIFPSGSDPDTGDALIVNMVENSGPLDAGTDSDADSGVTLCFVDGELISYSSCTISGPSQFTMSQGAPSVAGYIRRGQLGSAISSHGIGGLFMRLDKAIFQYTYDPTWAGQELYFKFLSFNQFKNSVQGLEDVDATTFTVPGMNSGTVEASSGLIVIGTGGTSPLRPIATPLTPGGVGAGPLGWAAEV